MNTFIKLPFYARVSLVLIGMYVFICILSKMQSIILPALYAIMIATSISPIVNFMVRKKINRTIAIMSVLAVSLLIAGMFIMLLSSQASLLSEAWPRLAAKFQTLLDQSVAWASGYFNISADKIDGWLLHEKTALMSNSNAAIGVTLTTMSGVLTAVLVIPVYIFMILFYQPHLVEFILKVFGAGNDHKVSEILAETKSIIQSYLSGLFAEFVIVAILNSIGLLLLGIDYAILLGVVGALLNIIPYIGGIIGVLLFMVIALVTKTPVYVFYVVMMYTVI
jgi:predicted PurR-regulated permease PerM